MTFKNGKRFDADIAMGQDESNWFLQIAEDHVPSAAAALSDRAAQLPAFALRRRRCPSSTWELSSAERLDIEKAIELQEIFHASDFAGTPVGRWCCGPSMPPSWTSTSPCR